MNAEDTFVVITLEVRLWYGQKINNHFGIAIQSQVTGINMMTPSQDFKLSGLKTLWHNLLLLECT